MISDEDVLEFVCALQTAHYMPERLFAELERNHLLMLGGGFSDWLTRLFLRLAKRRRLSDPRESGETLADSHAFEEPGLVFFLQQVSSRTRLFSGGAAASAPPLDGATRSGDHGRLRRNGCRRLATICAGKQLNDDGEFVSAADGIVTIDDVRREVTALS